MKEKIKTILNFLKRYRMVSLIILTGVGLFIWYELRPNLIRSHCQRQALELGIKSKLTGGLEEYEFFYKSCLRINGLEK